MEVYMIEGYTSYEIDAESINWDIYSTKEQAELELAYLKVVMPESDLNIYKYGVEESAPERKVIVVGVS